MTLRSPVLARGAKRAKDPAEVARARPFLKWAGGKRAIVPRLLELLPPVIETYYEPFLGGGALFFALVARGVRFEKAVLADQNEELVNCYQVVRDDVKRVIAALRKHENTEHHYYRVREADPSSLGPAEQAARLIFLNRTGYNGLYRVNSKGRFNVPFGRYKKPRLDDAERLETASRALKKARIDHRDFEKTVKNAGDRDFVYFDPPYVPLSLTANFTAYGQAGFAMDEQQRLADLLRRLGRANVPALLSNSDCAATRTLYAGLDLGVVSVRRAINSVASGRGPVAEVLVRSFDYPVLSNPDGEPGRDSEADGGAPRARDRRAGGKRA